MIVVAGIVVAGDFGVERGASAAGTDLAESGCSASFGVVSARQPKRESARTARIAVDWVRRISTFLLYRCQIWKVRDGAALEEGEA